ncbi:MAG TPA: rod shape-determining protein MreC [Actinomycetota bacterium]|nr:rod shape-determining protein MreC [Actinomycetota bacterium]
MVTRQRPRATRLLVVVLVSISLAVITLDYRQQDGPLSALGTSTKAAMAPMQRAVTNVTRPVGDFFSGLAHLPSLSKENQELKDELAAAHAEDAVNDLIQVQNEELQGLLDLRATLDPEPIAAVVIANGLSNFEWTITIDKGSNDGIAKDQPVVTGSAEAPMLVGRVVQVSPDSADVRLIIDRESAVAAVLKDSGEAGLIHGQGDADLRMTDVEPGTVTEGDVEQVFTLGYEVTGQPGLYPPDLLIGQVSRTVPADNATEEFIEVRPAVDFATLQFVLVLKARTEA